MITRILSVQLICLVAWPGLLCRAQAATGDQFKPRGSEILVNGVKIVRIQPGDDIGLRHCINLLDRAGIDSAIWDSIGKPYLETSGPSWLVVSKKALSRARSVMAPYVKLGFVDFVEPAKAPAGTKPPAKYHVVELSRVSVNGKLSRNGTKFAAPLLSFMRDHRTFKIDGILSRVRDYLASVKTSKLVRGYDIIILASDRGQLCQYHAQLLHDSTVTRWILEWKSEEGHPSAYAVRRLDLKWDFAGQYVHGRALAVRLDSIFGGSSVAHAIGCNCSFGPPSPVSEYVRGTVEN